MRDKKKKWKIEIVGEIARDGDENVCVRCFWRELYPRCPAHPIEPDDDVEFELDGEYVLCVDYLDEWREESEAPTDEDTWLDSTMILCDKFKEMLWHEG